VIFFLLFLAPKVLLTTPVRDYADVTVQYDKAGLKIMNVRRGRFDKPTALPKYRGRFVAHALGQKKQLEEVRFDLPLLADAETDDATDEARKFADRLRSGTSVKATVRVPLPEGSLVVKIDDSKTTQSVSVSLATAPSPIPGAAGANAPPGR
jgi:hypothetical protein